ncbi:MAG TPA: hypothetical protein VMU02_01630 [bacterium]|nr:hypothetical protein [bacterium]
MKEARVAERDHLEESLHYLMINVLVDSLESEGFTVAADHVGGRREQPAPIGDFIPDIQAKRGEEIHLIEVETQSTLASPRFHDQLARLAAQAGVHAYVAVPFDCIEKVRRLREALNLRVGIMPCYPFVGYIGTSK